MNNAIKYNYQFDTVDWIHIIKIPLYQILIQNINQLIVA